MMNFQNQLLIYVSILVVFSCTSDREWENPYDPDSGIEFTAPEITSITPVDFDRMSIAWTSNDSLYTIIQIERSLSSQANSFAKITEVDASASPYTDTGLEFGNTYYYRVRGMADEVEGSYSAIANGVLNLPAPTDLSATALSDHQVQLTWNYSLLAKLSRYWIPVPSVEPHDENSNEPGPKEMVRPVKLIHDDLKKIIGESEAQSPEASGENLVPASSGKNEIVILLNDSSTVLERTWGMQGFEEGFIIERADYSGEFAVIDTVDAGEAGYGDSSLSFGTTYRYRVCAYADIYKSAYVTLDSVSTIFPTPTNLTATATSDQSIALSWSDNCSFEAGYEVWRKTGSGNYEILDSTASNGTAYADSGLTYGETYAYKLRAFTELNSSAYTSELSTSTTYPVNIIHIHIDG